ncbi:DUF397 domain-containing protein [Streptomyces sp. Y2F8-2]|uniref:DUF397 domain-containing protein n=1 Tax=Streptomyces sp. Y2F8-2 TaxID=2759675 RepID=UPI001908193B|nr:DUF397 domain-containing protein [Streptomyces sp. Y2F8-2]GHK04737.1 DUF397 domain-containing protein [Streptomyces sp. Y2F8-2]
MNVEDLSRLKWIKSSYSDGQGGQCVEVATVPATIHIRDSKHTPETGPTLMIPFASWEAFIGFTARQ